MYDKIEESCRLNETNMVVLWFFRFSTHSHTHILPLLDIKARENIGTDEIKMFH